MTSLQPYQKRPVLTLPRCEAGGWHLKRYVILAPGRAFDEAVVAAAAEAAFRCLPEAGLLHDEAGNQGVAFQIVHFAQVAVVSPVFYWQWGSVLARPEQMRASWDAPTVFVDGASEVIGCVWEMNIVQFEVTAWTRHLLSGEGAAEDGLAAYLQAHAGA